MLVACITEYSLVDGFCSSSERLVRDYPPTHMVNNDAATFWVATLLYPQEIVMQFRLKWLLGMLNL